MLHAYIALKLLDCLHVAKKKANITDILSNNKTFLHMDMAAITHPIVVIFRSWDGRIARLYVCTESTICLLVHVHACTVQYKHTSLHTTTYCTDASFSVLRTRLFSLKTIMWPMHSTFLHDRVTNNNNTT
jgi:hypothetical protein